MTSKEYLKKICEDCEKDMAKIGQRCPFRSISNDYCDDIETILKDLNKLDEIEKILERRTNEE